MMKLLFSFFYLSNKILIFIIYFMFIMKSIFCLKNKIRIKSNKILTDSDKTVI